jgi:hypothetical protein
MSAINDGGAAFPVIPPVDETGRTAVGYPYPEGGMTLRDYFAAKAMQALIAAGADKDMRGYPGWREELGQEAYLFAKAMLKAR